MFIKLEISAFNINTFRIYFLLCLVQEKKDDMLEYTKNALNLDVTSR